MKFRWKGPYTKPLLHACERKVNGGLMFSQVGSKLPCTIASSKTWRLGQSCLRGRKRGPGGTGKGAMQLEPRLQVSCSGAD